MTSPKATLARLLPALALAGASLAAQTPINPTPIPAVPGLRGPTVPKPGTDRIMTSAVSLVFATHAPGDTTRLFVAEQRGRILVLDLGTLTVNATPFLDIDALILSGSERGLLGLAFHPDYASNGLFYVNYSRNGDGDTVIAEYAVTADPNIADPASARILMTINQPQSNHNGGWIGFGPNDGYLYIATGDGGNFCDTGTGHTSGIGNSQDITTNLLGKMLRIDPLAGLPYGIPNDNPFVGIDGDDEIWAYGLRNPWRASFDRSTGDLYIGDVGQDIREEVNYQSAGSIGGENYGWRCREGLACSTAGASGCPSTTGCTCPTAQPSLIDPVHDYSHGGNPGICSVVGGYVYRGSALPQFQGRYFFADYCRGDIWSFRVENGVKTGFRSFTGEFSPSIDGFNIGNVQSFGEDASGELYVVSTTAVFKIVPRP